MYHLRLLSAPLEFATQGVLPRKRVRKVCHDLGLTKENYHLTVEENEACRVHTNSPKKCIETYALDVKSHFLVSDH
jgi:hypothetical protein